MVARQGHVARAPEIGVIDRRELARVLGRANVADWAVIQRDQELGVVDEAVPGMRRAEHRTRWQLTVRIDTPAGRGSALVEIDALGGDPAKVVDQAIALAQAAIGPAWATIPPAAPARVDLADPALATLDPIAIGESILHDLVRPAPVHVVGCVKFLREHVAVSARQGFHTEWDATLVQVDLAVTANQRSLDATREARLRHGLALDGAVTAAAADLELLATATPPTGGSCAIILTDDALLHDGLGVWAAFTTQADAVVARQGLTRYHEQTPIVAGADQVPEPLTIVSDGAQRFGVRSAPLGDEGEAVRRFTLVDRGIAADLGLSPREASLRRRDPNGGVRNLVVTPGTWSGALDPGRVVEVRRLRALAIDPYTGDASLEIALAIDHATGKPFTGGTLRLDLIDVLARARRSATQIRRGPYDGPDRVLIDHAELIA